jgi:hypothetical protein
VRSTHLVLFLLAGATGCTQSVQAPVPSYDEVTRRLIRLSADLDGDGRADQWTFLEGSRPLRTEIDADGDRRIERWEYFDATGALAVVGTSSRGDGTEDTWSWAEDQAGERRVDVSSARDRAIDRREFYRGESLVRVDADTNLDGLIDRWERFDGGRLREVSVDTTRRRGRADRRLLYDESARFTGLEEDSDGDGVFTRPPSPESLRAQNPCS